MFVRVKPKPNGKKSIQIVESYRRADKISQKIVRHVGQAVTDREVEELSRLAQSIIDEMESERQPRLPLLNPLTVVEKKQARKACDDTVKIKHLREEQRIVDALADMIHRFLFE